MSDDGVHKKNAGERKGTLPRQPSHTMKLRPKIGLRGIVTKSQIIKCHVGYDAKEAPRNPRGIVSDNKYGISFGNKYR